MITRAQTNYPYLVVAFHDSSIIEGGYEFCDDWDDVIHNINDILEEEGLNTRHLLIFTSLDELILYHRSTQNPNEAAFLQNLINQCVAA